MQTKIVSKMVGISVLSNCFEIWAFGGVCPDRKLKVS